MQETTKNSKNTSQCGSSTRTADGSSRIHCRKDFPEPSADALRASADGASRTQDLAIFSGVFKTQFPPAVRVIHPQSTLSQFHKNPVFTRSAGHPSAVAPTVRVRPPAVEQNAEIWSLNLKRPQLLTRNSDSGL